MSPAKVAPPAVLVDEPSAKSRAAKWTLTALVVAQCVAIIVLASIISFWSIRSLAGFFHWPPFLQILLMPMIELFILAGMAEHVHQKIEGGRGIIPLLLSWVAMVVSLGCNVGQHTLMFIAAQPGTETWYIVVLGIFGALAPFGQIGGTHMLMTRIGRVAQAYRLVKPAQQGPKAGAMIRDALAQRAVAAIQNGSPPAANSTGPAAARTPGRAPVKAAKRTGRRPSVRAVDVMRAHWDEQVARGHVPTEAELDRIAGTNRMAKKYRPAWDSERVGGVVRLDDRRAAQ